MKISRRILNELSRLAKLRTVFSSYPIVYGLGKTDKNVIRRIEEIKTGFTGCKYMKSLTSSELARVYIKLAKQKTTFCGFVRMTPSYLFEEQTDWHLTLSGPAIKQNWDVVITIDYEGNRTSVLKWDSKKKGRKVTMVELEIVR